MSDESIFTAALGKAPGLERRAFLDEACGGDGAMSPARRGAARGRRPDRRHRRARPRRPHATRRGPASGPATASGRTSSSSRSARGAWAPSTWPSRPSRSAASVALKIIKPGMDSRQVIARFEAERQALAMMDHQNIARVLDAGTTDSGRPYFVMELVHGVPITQFCDENHLTPRQRLELFVPGLPGDPACPSEGDHPPRHQAVQRPGDDVRRQAGAQGDRLRRGQGDRAAADRKDDVHPVRRLGRHVRVHEPRAGAR